MKMIDFLVFLWSNELLVRLLDGSDVRFSDADNFGLPHVICNFA